ncbi:NPCBM/NEW2 domain-containing protein, partial [Deinococcus pimensis]|uniref:NPCBM/NEW2 domain-containing protein n=1 Tax=Deinococcus pimensis TaxID=309888 RepID=UPI0005EB5BC6
WSCGAPAPQPSGEENPYAGGRSYPWSAPAQIDPSNPYATPTPWPTWTSPTAPHTLTTQATTTNHLSDLTPTSATNAWGPIEKDQSNGEQAQGDGRPLTVRGTTTPKGLGVHAASTVTYTLGAQCTTLTGSVGIDDETKGRGSAVFSLQGDGRTLYTSPKVTGTSAAVSFNVDVTGVQTLKLIVTDGGDGIDYDHADWLDPILSCATSAPPSGTTPLTDLTYVSATNGWGPVERDRSNGENLAGDGVGMKIEGVAFARGLGVHAGSVVRYALDGRCSVFETSVGVDDEVGARGSVVFEVWRDGVRAWSSGVRRGTDAAVSARLDVSGASEVRLVVSDAGDGKDYDHADWAGPTLTCVTTTESFPQGGVSVNFQPASTAVPNGFVADTGAPYSATRGYGWIREDSVGTATPTPLDLSTNLRDRADPSVDVATSTLIHMQYPTSAAGTGNKTPGAWEYALPNGTYNVTVGVGDASNSFDSTHQLNVEGQAAVSAFEPTEPRKFFVGARRVTVTDGRLTLDARGGINTKLDWVRIQPGDRPAVRYTGPQAFEKMVDLSRAVTADLNLVSAGVDVTSMTPTTVRLYESATGTDVAASRNTSGGSDVVVLRPSAPLKPNTRYTFEITGGLRDIAGSAFRPFSTSFVTGSATTSGNAVAFEKVELPTTVGMGYTAVEIGPDNKLYAANIVGEIRRFGINADGTLGTPEVIKSVQNANGGPRSIVGLKFAPASTADNLVLYVSNNYFWGGPTSDPAPDWSGKITRLSGPNLENVQDVVVGLPRSAQDHMTNSIALRPSEPNVLYVLQGSNSSLGAPDVAWRNRPERLLTAALLRVDLTKIGTLPLDVRTEDGGTYDPYAPNAPLTIFASGIRNAYDMVWHTNGRLYVPTNGSAAGGNAPATPSVLPAACARRGYGGPAVPGITGAGVQNDYLFKVEAGGYYGHPNPLRCEYAAFGANPTSAADPMELAEYPVGTRPDPNWRGFAYDFGQHASPNGVIEEYTLAGNSALRNKLLVVRFSAGRDIIVLTPGADGNIVAAQERVSGLTDFSPAPLDLVENRENGYLYVAQLDQQNYGSGKITLVRPR